MADLDSLLERLIEFKVEFVIVGGFAAVTHGVSLQTVDIDICCRFSVENLLKIQKSIQDLHPVHRMTPSRLALKITPESCKDFKNLYLDTDYGQLDCLNEVLGVGDFDEVKRKSIEIELDCGECRVLDLNALIVAKQAMNRPKDRETVLQLKVIKERSKKKS